MDLAQIETVAALYNSPCRSMKGNALIRCPLASLTHKNRTDHSPALSVKVCPDNVSLAHCFACGAKGTVYKIFQRADNSLGGFDSVVQFIRENDKIGFMATMRRIMLARNPIVANDIDSQATQLDSYIARCFQAGVPNYVLERGLLKKDISKWQVGYDSELQRAVFPCWDHKGNIVGASRRAVRPNQRPKFHDTPGNWKSEVFYGENLIDTTNGTAYLAEGVMGTIFLSRAVPNALGFLGAHVGVNDVRLHKLKKWFDTLVFVFDADEAGHRAVFGDENTRGLRSILRRYFVLKYVKLPNEHDGAQVKDPSDIPKERLVAALDSAKPC